VAKKKQRGGGGRGAGGGEEDDRRGKAGKPVKENAFETLWTRKKFDVLGKKQKKGEKKRVGQSRSLAVEKVCLDGLYEGLKGPRLTLT
jgi:hypothetical protein